jgi:hypothetical protein
MAIGTAADVCQPLFLILASSRRPFMTAPMRFTCLPVVILLMLAVSGCGFMKESRIQVGAVERIFHLRYVTSIKDCEIGDEYRLWIPVPHDDPHQKIDGMKVRSPVEGSLYTENRFGNSMYYFEGICSASQLDFTIEYDVTRHTYIVDSAPVSAQETDINYPGLMALYLQPSSLCYVTPVVKREAEILTTGKESVAEIARSFFDHVLKNMSYGKSHPGWGRGDITHACDVGMGNCTDFHTYFNALCLASGIPSRFQIGMWGKYYPVNGEYKAAGYHCWCEFHVPGKGWVPVDLSEADRDPNNIDRYFASHTGNRVTLSTGRDLILMPRQAGPPINYFVNPYVEMNGQLYDKVSKNCFWTDSIGSE